jgi:hypothetical protein
VRTASTRRWPFSEARTPSFGEDRGDVALDGALGDEQPAGDAAVALALGHAREDGAQERGGFADHDPHAGSSV